MKKRGPVASLVSTFLIVSEKLDHYLKNFLNGEERIFGKVKRKIRSFILLEIRERLKENSFGVIQNREDNEIFNLMTIITLLSK